MIKKNICKAVIISSVLTACLIFWGCTKADYNLTEESSTPTTNCKTSNLTESNIASKETTIYKKDIKHSSADNTTFHSCNLLKIINLNTGKECTVSGDTAEKVIYYLTLKQPFIAELSIVNENVNGYKFICDDERLQYSTTYFDCDERWIGAATTDALSVDEANEFIKLLDSICK